MMLGGFAEAATLQPISFEEAIDVALKENLEIKIVRQDYEIAQNLLSQAEGIWDLRLKNETNFLHQKEPQAFEFFGLIQKTFDWNFHLLKKIPLGTEFTLEFLNERFDTNSAFYTINPSYDVKYGLGIKHPLLQNWFGANDRASVEQAAIKAEDLDLGTAENIEKIAVKVSHAYWDLALGEANVSIRQKHLDQARQLNDFREKKFRDGLIEEPELYASKANLAERENDFILAKQELELKSNELALHLGNPLGSYRAKSLLKFQEVEVSFQDGLEYAKQHRRDFRQAKLKFQNADLGYQVAYNKLLPRFDLEGTLHYGGLDDDYGASIRETSKFIFPIWYVGVEFEYPLENRKANSDWHVAQSERVKADVGIRLAEQRIEQEVRNQVLIIQTLMEQVKNRQRIQEFEGKKLKEETGKFERGRSKIDVVIDYQKDLRNTELALAKAKAEYLHALVDWEDVQDRYFEGKRFAKEMK